MKIIRNNTTLIVVFDDGAFLQTPECTDEMFNAVCASTTKEEVIAVCMPSVKKIIEERDETLAVVAGAENSKLLTREGDSIYWKSVSSLSLPQDFAEKIVKAEQEEDADAIESYHNFWTLLSLNSDEVVRKNLYWFLSRWGFKLSKSGLFVGYRNVDILERGTDNRYSQEFCDFVTASYEKIKRFKKSPKNYFIDVDTKDYKLLQAHQIEGKDVSSLQALYDGFRGVDFDVSKLDNGTVYTDQHSHTFRIELGKMVTMPREQCDCDSSKSCSKGLHLGGQGWLSKNYCGAQGLVCVCNPVDVVAVPYEDNYGKIRCCAYMPIALAEYDDYGRVIPYNLDDGFESSYIKDILYDGIKATEDSPEYTIVIPNVPYIDKESVREEILNIARTYMK